MKDFMHDTEFLKALDLDRNKIIYAKIISLTRDEQPIEAIEGVVQSGSINIDGASAVRRSCNLTMTTKMLNINEVYWGFTTKIKVEIGVQNNIDSRYDKIVWFKQGIYVLTDFKTSQQVNNYVITVQGKDKMCLLNGDIGGHFTAETNLGEEDRVDAEGNTTTYKVPLTIIIREMIHHYAQEPWANIILTDVDDYGLKLLDNNNTSNNYYLWYNIQKQEYEFLTDADAHILNPINNIDETQTINIDNTNEALTNIQIYLKTLREKVQELHDNYEYLTKKLITVLNNYTNSISKAIDDETKEKLKNEKRTYYNNYIIMKQNLLGEKYPLPHNNQSIEIDPNSEDEIDYNSATWWIIDPVFPVNPHLPRQSLLYNYEDDGHHDGIITDSSEIGILSKFYRNLVSSDSNNFFSLDLLEFSNFIFLNGLEEDANQLIATRTPSKIITTDKNEYYLFFIKKQGQAGYELTNLTYDGDLIAAPGDTITSILDKIVKMLGSFEYFYNLDGQFVFQAKATYLNTQWSAGENLDDIQSLSYINPAVMRDKTSYYFENGTLVTSLQNNPNLLNVRNDFTVWGKKKSTSGSELPIHVRYAVDKKPLFYCRQPNPDSQTTSNEQFYQNLYMTQEGYDLIVKLMNTNIDEEKYHHTDQIPNAFGHTTEEKAQWWNMQDWAEYYKAFVGNYPTDYIYKYQDPNSAGFTGSLYFANGLTVSPGTYNLGMSPFGVVDIQRLTENPMECLPAGFKGIKDGRLVLAHSAFMHRYNGCYHHYSDFLKWQTNNGYESYFYRPTLSFANTGLDTQDISAASIYVAFNDKNLKLYETNIVDWRELIYLMAKDYYKYNHDDEFEINIANTNRLCSEIFQTFDYLNGKTGYEQYYHDIEGFWRLLYDKTHVGETVWIWETQVSNGIEVTYDFDGWNELVKKDPTGLLFWFDFYDTNAAIGQFSVPAIGPRTKVVNDEKVRVIVYPDTPDVIYNYVGESIISEEQYNSIEKDSSQIKISHSGYSVIELKDIDIVPVQEEQESQQQILKTNNFYNSMKISIRSKSAKEVMDSLVYQYTHTNDSITLNTVPIYYLQPNSIIHIYDELSHINGYYEVKKITVPLAYNGTMNIQATYIPQQIY